MYIHIFTAALFTMAKIWKQIKCPSIDEQTNKNRCMYATKYSALKKNAILSFVTTWMDLEDIVVNEISQIDEDKCCKISLIFRIQKSKQTKKQNRNKFIDIEIRLMDASGDGHQGDWVKNVKGIRGKIWYCRIVMGR